MRLRRSVPFGGITRIRFLGYDLSPERAPPLLFVDKTYFFSSLISYILFQFFPVRKVLPPEGS